MAIILKNGAVFLHIPKTGGTWVTDVLSELDLVGLPFKHKHLTLQRLPPDRRQFTLGVALRVLKRPNRARRKALSHLLARRPFIFTFTRHPLAWYESWYAYMSLEKNNWRDWGIKGRKDMKNWHPCADLNGLGGGILRTLCVM